MDTPSKVTADHLRRSAYLYVRQSTLRQVHENCDSTARQHDLKRRAQVLGWTSEQIVVIDEDLGCQGPPRSIAKAFNASWRRSAPAMWVWLWAWRFPVWRAVRQTDIGCWRSALWPIR